jgi:hypothetical protein
MREWDGLPAASLTEQRRQWSAARDEWLEFYGYDVFDLNDAELELARNDRRVSLNTREPTP